MYDIFLPVVKPEISGPLEHEISSSQYDEEYLESQLARIDEENPMIGQWIRTFAETTDDETGAAFCALVVYRMLESQAEANKMNFQYGRSDE